MAKQRKFQLAGRRDVVVPVLIEYSNEDEFGRPTECRIRYDEEVIDLTKSKWSDGVRRFMIAFVSEHMLKPKTKGNA